MRTYHVPAALLLLLTACVDMDTGPARTDVPVDSAAGEVAFELAGPGGAALVVPVRINGQGPYRLVLDTGATMTCITPEIATQLELAEASGIVGTGAGVGSQGRLRLVAIDSLHVGEISAHQLHACVIDLQNLEQIGLDIDGLLGLNVLKEFRVTLDFERNVLTLAEP